MLALVGSIAALAVGYLIGFERGVRFCSKEGPVLPMPVPLLRSMHRKEKRKPKSISEFDQWKKEQGIPPSDPGN